MNANKRKCCYVVTPANAGMTSKWVLTGHIGNTFDKPQKEQWTVNNAINANKTKVCLMVMMLLRFSQTNH